MFLSHEREAELQDLLGRNLHNPIPEPGATHVEEWLRVLADRFPLWSMRPEAHARYLTGLRRLEELESMVASLWRDDRIFPERAPWLDFPELIIDRRRYAVAHDAFDANWVRHDGALDVSAPAWVPPKAARFVDVPEMMYDSERGEGEIAWRSVRDAIADLFLSCLEERWSARTKAERSKAEQRMRDFLVRVGAQSPAKGGRARKAPPAPLLKALVTEGIGLIRLLPEAFPATLTQSVEHTLRRLSRPVQVGGAEVRDSPRLSSRDTEMIAARLALPVFSKLELLALREQLGRARKGTLPRDMYPSPFRLTISILEHRLGCEAHTLARAAHNSREAAYFKPANPIPIDAQ